jgi:hypothetical protein
MPARRLPTSLWHWLRISVRGLILLVLIVGVWLGWMVRAARVQRQAVAAIRASGGRVMYDWQKQGSGRLIQFDLDGSPEAPWAKWLADRLGVDYFGHVFDVSFVGADPELAYIRRLPRLESLSICGSASVTDAGLVHLERMTDLRSLFIDHGGIGDAGLAHLKGLTGLRSFMMHAPRVTGAGLASLEGLKRLEGLYLSGPAITDAGMPHIGRLAGLRDLALTDTRVTDAGLVHLRGRAGLGWLSLCRTQVTDAGLVHLEGLVGLRVLSLRGTRVTDVGLRHLKGLTRLRVLDLTKTRVTDAGARELQGLLPRLSISR